MKKSLYILSCLIVLFCSCQKDESVPVSSVTLDTSKITVKLGDFYQLSATVSPNNATNNAVVWMSTDAGIASVSGGLVSANGLGVAEITVKADDNGLSDHCMVTVVPEVIPLETIVLDRNEISLYEKESDTIKLSLFPVDTTEPDIFWTSSNDSVAVVNGGIVTALMAGQTTLRASSADGTSYLELVSFLRANGASPKTDLVELFRRVVFNMAVSNTDDHLRNHGFILTRTGWSLSPLFDVNPIPYGEYLSLNV